METLFRGTALIGSHAGLQRQLPSVRKFHPIPITLFIHSLHWSVWREIGDRFRLKSLIGFNWNCWSESVKIRS